MTRVAYIGNFKHAHCTEVALAYGFTQAGCTVTCIQQEEASAAASSDPLPGGRPDLLIYTRTHNVTALTPHPWNDRWRALEYEGVKTASFHLDRFWDLPARERWIAERDPLFTVGTCFTADGGNQDRWLDAGVNHVWLPPAIDVRFANVGRQLRGLQTDVLFVGSVAGYHPEYPQRGQLLRYLQDRYRDRFRHVGAGAPGPAIRGAGLDDLYASAKVVVGDSIFANGWAVSPAQPARYWSDRIPETLGRGGTLVHPWTPGLGQLFTLGVDLAVHRPGDFDDLGRVVDALLADPDRASLGAAGHETVLARHTYTHRARSILAHVGLAAPHEDAVPFSAP